jgi:hypothetical protein
MEGFLRVSALAAKHRQARRVSQDEFIRMSREAGTIVLDARSKQRFDELHVKWRDPSELPGYHDREPWARHPGQENPHPDLLQQQLPQREGRFRRSCRAPR